MGRFLYWINFKKRKELRSCGACCLNCRFYKECKVDGVVI